MDFGFDQDRYEWTTLTQSQPARRWRWSFSMVLATAVHGVVILLLCWPAIPAFIRPNTIAYGESGGSTPASVVLYAPTDLQLATSSQPPLLSLPAAAKKKPQKTKIRKRNNVLEV